MQAQLDATLTQLQELKLQKLELEQKLQQRAQTSSLPGEVQSVVFFVPQKAEHHMRMHLNGFDNYTRNKCMSLEFNYCCSL